MNSNNSPTTETHTLYEARCVFENISKMQFETEQAICQFIKNDNQLNFVTLSIVEAMVNVFEHGFSLPEDREIDAENEAFLKVELRNNFIEVCLMDNGNTAPDSVIEKLNAEFSSFPSIHVDLQDLPESGWGLTLINHAASHTEYYSKDNYNYLELSFDLEPNS